MLHAHEDQRSKDLRANGSASPARGRLLQAPRQIAPHAIDEGRMCVEKPRDRLQDGLELNALLDERDIGEADLEDHSRDSWLWRLAAA